MAIGLVLGVMMVAFEITAVHHRAADDHRRTATATRLYGVALACYTLANLVALVVTGELTDRYGPAKPYLASLAVFAAGLDRCGNRADHGVGRRSGERCRVPAPAVWHRLRTCW